MRIDQDSRLGRIGDGTKGAIPSSSRVYASCRFPASEWSSHDHQSPSNGDKETAFRRTAGLEFLGEYFGSGTVEPLYLIRRDDGQTFLVSNLLYLVATELDQCSDYGSIAVEVSHHMGRAVSAGNVEYLVETKLRSLGLLEGDSVTDAGSAQPVLALTSRHAVVPGHIVSRAAYVLSYLYVPVVVTAVLAAFAVMDAWIVWGHSALIGVQEVSSEPELVLLICALTILAGGFHEFGHAAASSYAGAEPGVIGIGIYLIWPVFFSDLTDTYRLSRAGRLRADLGGVYFNVVFMLLVLAVYAGTGMHWLLLLIVLQHLAVLHQLLPFFRLDGYYLVSDLTGVPDLFGLVRPILAGLLPGRSPSVAIVDLKRWVRVVVTAWVVATVSTLAIVTFVVIFHLPQIASGTVGFVHAQAASLASIGQSGAMAPALLAALRLSAAAIPAAGLLSALVRGVQVWRR